jgi:hypothetical protein
MYALIATMLISIAPAQAPASAPVWEQGPTGQTAVIPMRCAPYPHASRADGFKINDKTFPRDPNYTDSSVALFIPKTFRPGPTTNLLFYFHGHSNNVRKALDFYKLREQVQASGQNLVMVFPQGPKDATDSGCGKLEDKDGLKHLADEVMQMLVAEGKVQTPRVGRVFLTGHSGAYRVISFCVEQGGLEDHIAAVGLLDASYGRLEPFVDWAKRNPAHRFFSIFTDHLAPENVFLMTRLRRASLQYVLYSDEDADAGVLAANRILFVHTDRLDHNGTVQWLEPWLRSIPPATQPSAG